MPTYFFKFFDEFEYSFAFIVFPGIYPNFDISWHDILRTLRPMANFSYSATIRRSQEDCDCNKYQVELEPTEVRTDAKLQVQIGSDTRVWTPIPGRH